MVYSIGWTHIGSTDWIRSRYYYRSDQSAIAIAWCLKCYSEHVFVNAKEHGTETSKSSNIFKACNIRYKLTDIQWGIHFFGFRAETFPCRERTDTLSAIKFCQQYL